MLKLKKNKFDYFFGKIQNSQFLDLIIRIIFILKTFIQVVIYFLSFF